MRLLENHKKNWVTDIVFIQDNQWKTASMTKKLLLPPTPSPIGMNLSALDKIYFPPSLQKCVAFPQAETPELLWETSAGTEVHVNCVTLFLLLFTVCVQQSQQPVFPNHVTRSGHMQAVCKGLCKDMPVPFQQLNTASALGRNKHQTNWICYILFNELWPTHTKKLSKCPVEKWNYPLNCRIKFLNPTFPKFS